MYIYNLKTPAILCCFIGFVLFSYVHFNVPIARIFAFKEQFSCTL